jgi:serine protease AprX
MPAAKRTNPRATKRVAKPAAKKAAKPKAVAKKAARAKPRSTAAAAAAAATASVAVGVGAPFILVPSERRERAEGKMGPLLRRALAGLEGAGKLRSMARLSMDFAERSMSAIADDDMVGAAAAAPLSPAEAVLPVAAAMPRVPLKQGETWEHYRERVANVMGPVLERMKSNAGLSVQPVISANFMQTKALSDQLMEALQDDGIQDAEMDPPQQAQAMDDATQDVDLPLARFRHPTLDGTGVVVAVLDSGIDLLHPWLKVHASHSVQGQDIQIPGRHGTHVAGIIASRDTVYSGIAPGVTLLNIRILDAAGSGRKSDVGRGIDQALDMGAHIINLSVAFNHRPTWSQNGHGHRCPGGQCVACSAVNTALNTSNGAVAIIVAAGNEHEFCEELRRQNAGDTFDTELGCPGQAKDALTVGAITKQTFLTASFSSRGPTAYGFAKPEIAAPGVNITSAEVVPRDAQGQALANLTRAALSRKDSGTSMATPIVSGVAALLLQRLMSSGQMSTEALRTALRQQLLSSAFRPLAAPANEVGVGRISLASI